MQVLNHIGITVRSWKDARQTRISTQAGFLAFPARLFAATPVFALASNLASNFVSSLASYVASTLATVAPTLATATAATTPTAAINPTSTRVTPTHLTTTAATPAARALTPLVAFAAATTNDLQTPVVIEPQGADSDVASVARSVARSAASAKKDATPSSTSNISNRDRASWATRIKTCIKTRTKSTRIRSVAIAALVVFVVAEMFFLTYTALATTGPGKAPVSADPVALVSGQLAHNSESLIGNIGYDPVLTLQTCGSHITLVDTSKLKPLSNNYLTRAKNQDGKRQVVLIDETATARLLAFNSHWVAYLNNNDNAVFDDVLSGSSAEALVRAYDGFKIAFHRLAIGDIYIEGSNVYILAQPYYTVLKDGRTAAVNEVFLYKLVKQENTLVISEIEVLKVIASQNSSG